MQRLNRVARCAIGVDGPIQELRQRDYRGKRVALVLTDERGRSIKTKLDIGVHANTAITQVDFPFKVVGDGNAAVLLVNPNEQIFAEKLKTLLRLGIISTRYKDVYDLFYLSTRVDQSVLKQYLRICIYEDEGMMENDIGDVESRLTRVFSSRQFIRRMSNPNYAWLDVSAETVAATLLKFIHDLM